MNAWLRAIRELLSDKDIEQLQWVREIVAKRIVDVISERASQMRIKPAAASTTKTLTGPAITMVLDRTKFDKNTDYDDESPLRGCPAVVTHKDGRRATYWRASIDGRWSDGSSVSPAAFKWLLKNDPEDFFEKN